MSGTIKFNRNYATFSSEVRPFEQADDVGYVISEFLHYGCSPFYPIGCLIEAKISSIWLGEGEPAASDQDNLDLIFKMREIEGNQYYEIVLRSELGTRYGGYFGGENAKVTDEIVNGHRVITSEILGSIARFIFDGNVYSFDDFEANTGNPLQDVTIRRIMLKSHHSK